MKGHMMLTGVALIVAGTVVLWPLIAYSFGQKKRGNNPLGWVPAALPFAMIASGIVIIGHAAWLFFSS